MTWKQFSHGFGVNPIVNGSPEALVVLLHDLGRRRDALHRTTAYDIDFGGFGPFRNIRNPTAKTTANTATDINSNSAEPSPPSGDTRKTLSIKSMVFLSFHYLAQRPCRAESNWSKSRAAPAPVSVLMT